MKPQADFYHYPHFFLSGIDTARVHDVFCGNIARLPRKGIIVSMSLTVRRCGDIIVRAEPSS